MIPYGRQSIDETDIAALTEALRDDFLTTGPKIAAFEAALCDLTGARYAIACSSGTTALHLAALALDLNQGDAVIVPSMTFLATANAVRYCGAAVIFADVNSQTGLMEAEHVLKAISSPQAKGKTIKALLPVHLTGQGTNLSALKAIADEHHFKMIADSCHALGGTLHNHPIGACTIEDMNVFSFHPVKPITTGEGGAITTNDKALADKMRSLRSHGMIPAPDQGPWAYEMKTLGYNYRITDIQCALGLSQLKKLPHFIKRRQELVDLYDQALGPLAPHILPPARVEHDNQAGWHLYAPRIDFQAIGIDRARFMVALKALGVGSQVHYIPVHTQPYYKNLYGALDLKGAQHYYTHTLSLPLYPMMANEDIKHIIGAIKDIVRAKK